MKKTTLFIALALLVGARAFAQEWEHYFEYNTSDASRVSYDEAYELSDGRIMVASHFLFSNDCGLFRYSQPALLALTAEGTETGTEVYLKEGFQANPPYILENEAGEPYMMLAYNPDHDTCSANYFGNFNPTTDHSILGLYKLNDDLSIAESHETEIPIDIYEGLEHNPIFFFNCGHIHLTTAFVDTEGYIVGAYIKTVSYNYSKPRGFDSTFFFRMDFDGNMLDCVGYSGRGYSGCVTSTSEHATRHNLIEADSLYLFYGKYGYVTDEENKNLIYLDHDFNIVRTRRYIHKPQMYPSYYDWFDFLTVVRSPEGQSYVASTVREQYDNQCCCLYLSEDGIDKPYNVVGFRCWLERKTSYVDRIAQYKSVDVSPDNTLYYGYALKSSDMFDSWVVVERLGWELDSISAVYVRPSDDSINSLANSVTATADGGVIVTFTDRMMNMPKRSAWVAKYPTDVFVGVEEAHANGLKVAVAYPNPGQNTLNIHTALHDACVEVYDMTGRLMHRQAIAERVTSIPTEAWASGVYVWKVYTGVSTGSTTEAETGKWVKE